MTAKRVRQAAQRSDDANAFLRQGDEDGATRSGDDLAEYLGETFVRGALSGEDQEEVLQEEVAAEEEGGPFSETTEVEELGQTDDEETREATREPFPRAMHGLRRNVKG